MGTGWTPMPVSVTIPWWIDAFESMTLTKYWGNDYSLAKIMAMNWRSETFI